MLVVSKLDDNTALYIDAEAVGGVNKAEMEVFFDPDETLDDVVKIASGIGARLAAAATASAQANPAPRTLEMEFALKVDSNATISVARNLDVGQLRSRVVWTI